MPKCAPGQRATPLRPPLSTSLSLAWVRGPGVCSGWRAGTDSLPEVGCAVWEGGGAQCLTPEQGMLLPPDGLRGWPSSWRGSAGPQAPVPTGG